jgi:hemolysin III
MSTTCNITHNPTAISSESANQWTHALGWGLSLIGATLLVRAVTDCDDTWRTCGCLVYAASLVGVYAASTLSHAVTDQLWRNRFRMLDQICIFLLVVGTYTAYATTYARDGWLGGMLAVMWVIALLGIVARIRSGDESVSFAWYVALGWIPVLALGHILDTTGLAGTALAIGGGLVYTTGTWFLVNDHKHPHFHAVWHCFTMLGSLMHFVYVYQYVATLPVG